MWRNRTITKSVSATIALLSIALCSSFPSPAQQNGRLVDLATQAATAIIGGEAGEAVNVTAPGRLSGRMEALSADLNNDGLSDVIVGLPLATAPNGKTRAGRVYIIFGRRDLSPETVRDLRDAPADVVVHGANAGDQLGSALAAGDINGDGIQDLIIGAPFADEPNRPDVGNVYVLFGGSQLAARSVRDMASSSPTGPDIKLIGWGGPPNDDGVSEAMDNAGAAVAAGDINGDGVDDVLVGAPGQQGPDGTSRAGLQGFGADGGAVFVFFGGPSMPRVRDASQPLPAGVNMVLYGRVARIRVLPRPLPATEVGDAVGSAVAAADINGDGLADIIAGAPSASTDNDERFASGAVYIVFGRRRSTSDSPLVFDVEQNRRRGASGQPPPDAVIAGANIGESLGSPLAVGDVNGDRLADIITSALATGIPGTTGSTSGGVRVIFGARSFRNRDLANGADVSIASADVADELGFSVAAGDINGDGTADLILGAPLADGINDARSAAGEVYVLFGGAGLRGSITLGDRPADVRIIGARFADQFGFSLAAGDVNGDGTDDIIATSPLADSPSDPERPKIGITYVVFGGTP